MIEEKRCVEWEKACEQGRHSHSTKNIADIPEMSSHTLPIEAHFHLAHKLQ